MGKDFSKHFTKEQTQMANEHIKKGATSPIIREMQIRSKMKYHYVPIRMAKI